MLTPADAALADRDRDVPGLATLLDADGFAQRLQHALPEIGIEAAQLTYLRYKPNTSCLASYQLKTADTEFNLYARAHRYDALDKLNKARQKARADMTKIAGPAIIVLDDLATVIQIFPNDRRLNVLPQLTNVQSRQQVLSKLLPNRPDLWPAEAHLLRYKPERRYVAQLVTATGAKAILKAYDTSDYAPAKAGARAFSAGQSLQLTKCIGRSNRHRLLVFDWVVGRPLPEALDDPALNSGAVSEVGAALAELHAQSQPKLSQRSREDEITILFSIAVGIAAVCPGLAERAHALASHLSTQLLAAPRLAVPIHGDFSADQVILTEDGTAFVDFDNAVRADPAADLGSFLAQLERDSLAGQRTPWLVSGIRQRLLDGYRRATGGCLPDRINLYLATGLLLRAPHAFRNREPNWPERTQAILERAEEIANVN